MAIVIIIPIIPFLLVFPTLGPVPDKSTILTRIVHISIRIVLTHSQAFFIRPIAIFQTLRAYLHTAFVFMAAVVAIIGPFAHVDISVFLGLLGVIRWCWCLGLKLLMILMV